MADAGMGVSLLVPLNKNSGEFRVDIFGGDEEEVCVRATDVYYDLPPQVWGSMLHFPCSSAKMLIQRTASHGLGKTPTLS